MKQKNQWSPVAERGVDICAVEGCSRVVQSKGYCDPHYKRFWRYGDPLGGSTPRGALLAFLKDLIGHQGEDCVKWPYGGDDNGYGMLKFEGKTQTASRVMCILEHGPPEDPKHEAAHNCGKGNEGCVNPRHLRWASHADNQRDRLDHGTHNRGGQRRSNHQMTEDTVVEIRRRRADGERFTEIAASLGLNADAVRAAANGRT